MSNSRSEATLKNTSILDYYQDNHIDPVPIALPDKAAWETHIAKRRNLYERHLGIPLSMLHGRSVLEFGCNSGENALVLASMGAYLTLVEPNPVPVKQVLDLFSSFDLRDQVVGVVQESIEDYESDTTFDLVVAEGFLCALEQRDQMLAKVCRLTNPGGFAIVSFNDRVGFLLELVRKLLFWRAYRLEGLEDALSPEALTLAKRLYLEDFSRLNASRPFEAWYEDVLPNPFLLSEYFWSYQEILPLIEQEGCEFHSSSPIWTSVDRFGWYKNVKDGEHRHRELLSDWTDAFSFFLTGLPPTQGETISATPDVVDSVLELTVRISEFIQDPEFDASLISYPEPLNNYLSNSVDPQLRLFNKELKNLHLSLGSDEASQIIEAYEGSTCLRQLWGAPYHYVCIRKPR